MGRLVRTPLWAVALCSGVFLLMLGWMVHLSRRPQTPDLRSLEDGFGEFYSTDEIPREDVALALSESLDAIHGGDASPGKFAGAIEYYMMLGSRSGALDALKEARRRGLVDRDVESTARAWDLKG